MIGSQLPSAALGDRQSRDREANSRADVVSGGSVDYAPPSRLKLLPIESAECWIWTDVNEGGGAGRSRAMLRETKDGTELHFVVCPKVPSGAKTS